MTSQTQLSQQPLLLIRVEIVKLYLEKKKIELSQIGCKSFVWDFLMCLLFSYLMRLLYKLPFKGHTEVIDVQQLKERKERGMFWKTASSSEC